MGIQEEPQGKKGRLRVGLMEWMDLDQLIYSTPLFG